MHLCIMDLTTEQKSEQAAAFIEQAPPGEVNDVINDIRAIVASDDALMPHVLPKLREYNLSQLHTVDHGSSTSLISHAAILNGSDERYVDPRSKQSFAFDHVTLTASDYEAYELSEDFETIRAALDKSLQAYTEDHFGTGVSAVFCSANHVELSEKLESVKLDKAASEPVSAGGDAEVETALEKVEPGQATGDLDAAKPEVENTAEDTKAEGAEEVNAGETTEDVSAMDDAKAIGDSEVEAALEELVQADEEGKTGELVEAEPKAIGDSAVEEALKDLVKADEVEDLPASTNAAEASTAEASTNVAEASTFRKPLPEVTNPVYTLQIVGNRYNPQNFWTGRWRSEWVADPNAKIVTGSIHVDVHYYEQGNVQLATSHKAEFAYEEGKVVDTIAKLEAAYQLGLNDTYNALGDKAFKSLRRALPVTRQKVEWEKISGYKLGSDLKAQ